MSSCVSGRAAPADPAGISSLSCSPRSWLNAVGPHPHRSGLTAPLGSLPSLLIKCRGAPPPRLVAPRCAPADGSARVGRPNRPHRAPSRESDVAGLLRCCPHGKIPAALRRRKRPLPRISAPSLLARALRPPLDALAADRGRFLPAGLAPLASTGGGYARRR